MDIKIKLFFQNNVFLFTLFLLFTALVIPTVYAQDVYIQVDELPSWADHAGNVMYESTQAWQEANAGLIFYQVESASDADFSVHWVKEFGGEQHVGYAYGSQFIEVGLGDSSCGNKWNPYSEKYISHIMKHEIGHVFGHEHDNDPDSIMYPVALNREYGLVEEEYRLTGGYGQFVPFCTIKDLTSYEFSISTTDETFGFDYYIVPSYDEFEKWVDGKSFQHYQNKDCFGEGWLSFSGTCKGISKNSGIMVIMDDELTTPLEIITVTKLEKPDIVYSKSPHIPSKSPEIQTSTYQEENVYPNIESELALLVQENQIRELNQKITSLESLIRQLESENKKLKNDLLLEKLSKSDSQDKQNSRKIASFVDTTKDPQYYVDRYNVEPEYREWFDENYSEYSSIYEAVGKRQPVPDWIKTNAKWWSEGLISEDDFVKGLEYLVKEKIVNVN